MFEKRTAEKVTNGRRNTILYTFCFVQIHTPSTIESTQLSLGC